MPFLASFFLLALPAASAQPPAHWAYQPLAPISVPQTATSAWTRTSIDAFVLAQLDAQRLAPARDADKPALLRRVYFDLIGLPPSPQELQTFLNDPSPRAYESVVERLLASPRYGERWARHWMDAVHFAETHGHDQDRIRTNAWPYRDYLISSFNSDKPYSRFIQEQIAGDVLFPDDPQATVALGMIAAGPWDESSLRDIREDTIDRQIGRYLDRDDMVATVMQTFNSTTVQCARCHDHKFDPIPQRDYYALQSVFAGVDRANRLYDADPAVHRRRQNLLRQRKQLEKQPPSALSDLKSQLDRELAALPPPSFVYAAASDFSPDGGLKPSGSPRPVHVLKRGEITKPLELALPGALSCIPNLPARFDLPNPADEGARRAALATWLADSRNPLTWRSIVNRIWMAHFSRGLVETPNDFGKMGSPPSHPELLDWLALWFRDQAHGSLKQLHQLIVTSAVYRQSSIPVSPSSNLSDPDNRWLSHMNRARLDAEQVRDTILQISGLLDLRMGGPSDMQFDLKPGHHVTPLVDYSRFDLDGPNGRRRSIYRFLFRTLPDPFMDALDCPAGDQLTPMRNASVTVQQALALWNSAFVTHFSNHFAGRLAAHCSNLQDQITLAFVCALSRSPSLDEQQALASYAGKYGLANACRVLLNSNEFMFVN